MTHDGTILTMVVQSTACLQQNMPIGGPIATDLDKVCLSASARFILPLLQFNA